VPIRGEPPLLVLGALAGREDRDAKFRRQATEARKALLKPDRASRRRLRIVSNVLSVKSSKAGGATIFRYEILHAIGGIKVDRKPRVLLTHDKKHKGTRNVDVSPRLVHIIR
jgi:hypothetical protein